MDREVKDDFSTGVRPQRGQLVQLAVVRNVFRAGEGWRRYLNDGSLWYMTRSSARRCGAEDAAGAAGTAPVAPGRPSALSWLGPDVVAIAPGLAVRARTDVFAGAPTYQPHATQHSSCGRMGIHKRSGVVSARHDPWTRQHHAPAALWQLLAGERHLMIRDVSGSVCEDSGAAAGALQAVIGVRFDPGT